MTTRAVSGAKLLTPLAVFVPILAGLVTFVAIGAWGLRARHGSWGVPLAYVVGFSLMVALLAAVPGTPGFCET